MNRTTPTLIFALALSACGGVAAGSPSATEATVADGDDDVLSPRQLAKLDDVLRARFDSPETNVFPIRVKFNARPSRAELSEMYLVALDDDGVGRVDRATLKVIAGRNDVARIVFVDAGYAEDDHEFD
jgi:hypothetical protein